jgi:hypothetical protein
MAEDETVLHEQLQMEKADEAPRKCLNRIADFLIGDSSDSDLEDDNAVLLNEERRKELDDDLDARLEKSLSESPVSEHGIYFSVLNSLIFLVFCVMVNPVEKVAEVTSAVRTEIEMNYWDSKAKLQYQNITSIADVDRYVRLSLLPACYTGTNTIRNYNYIVGLRFTFKLARVIENTYDDYKDAVKWTLASPLNPNSDSADVEFTDDYGGFEHDSLGGFNDEGGYIFYMHKQDVSLQAALRQWREVSALMMNSRLMSLGIELVVHNRNLQTTVCYFQHLLHTPSGRVQSTTGSAGMFPESYEELGSFTSSAIALLTFFLLGLLVQIYKSVQMWTRVIKVLWVEFKLEIAWYEYIEIASIVLALTSVITYADNTLSYIGDFKVPVDDSDDLDLIIHKAVGFRSFVRVSALTSLLQIIKTIVVIQNKFPSFGILFETVRRANADIVNFGCVVMVLLTSFALMGVVCFGTHSDDFSSLGSAYFTLFSLMMGHTNSSSMQSANSSIAGVFLVAFVVLFVFILLNMFLVIIIATYYELREENQEVVEAKALLLSETVHEARRHWVNFLCCRISTKSEDEIAWDYYLVNQQQKQIIDDIDNMIGSSTDQENKLKELQVSLADLKKTILKQRAPSILERIKFNIGTLTSGLTSKLTTREQAKLRLRSKILAIREEKREKKLKGLRDERASNFKYYLVKDMLIFSTFLVLFITMTVLRFETAKTFELYKIMHESLSLTEFDFQGVRIDFSKVDRPSRAYEWIEKVLVPTTSGGNIGYQNVIISDLALRSTLDRVTLDKNKLDSSKEALLWTRTTSKSQNKDFFGVTGKAYRYTDKGSSDSFMYKGGFVQLYSVVSEGLASSMWTTFHDDLMDAQCASMEFELVTYNSNYNAFTLLIITFTQSDSGLFSARLEVNIIELETYVNSPGRAVLEVIFICFTAYYSYIEFTFWLPFCREANLLRLQRLERREIAEQVLVELGVKSYPTQGLEQIAYSAWRGVKQLAYKLLYLGVQLVTATYQYLNSSLFRVISFASIILSYVTIIQLILFASSSFRLNFELPCYGQDHFNEFSDLVILNNKIRAVLAFNLFVIFLRLLQFFKFSKKLSLLTDILQEAKFEITFFFLLFLVILFGYALMGFLLLGHYDSGFFTLGRSFMTLYAMLLGEFDTQALTSADSALGGLFFVTYMVLFKLLLLNMFIAIIRAHYFALNATNPSQQVRGFFAEILHVIRSYWRRRLNRVAPDLDITKVDESFDLKSGLDIKPEEESYTFAGDVIEATESSPSYWLQRLEAVLKVRTGNDQYLSRLTSSYLRDSIHTLAIVSPALENEVLILNEVIWQAAPIHEKVRLWKRLSLVWTDTLYIKREYKTVVSQESELTSLSKLQATLWKATSKADKTELWAGPMRLPIEDRSNIWAYTQFSDRVLELLPKYQDTHSQRAAILESSDSELEKWASAIIRPIRKKLMKCSNLESSMERLLRVINWREVMDDERLMLWAGLSKFDKQEMYLAQKDDKEALLIGLMFLEEIDNNIILLGDTDLGLEGQLDKQVYSKYYELATFESERSILTRSKGRLEDTVAEVSSSEAYKRHLEREIMGLREAIAHLKLEYQI